VPDSTVNLGDFPAGFMHTISYPAQKSEINQSETRGGSESYFSPEMC
jgi:hypothetical protein